MQEHFVSFPTQPSRRTRNVPVSGGASCALCQEQPPLLKGPAGLPLHARRCPLGPWDCWPQTPGPVKPGVKTLRLGASTGPGDRAADTSLPLPCNRVGKDPSLGGGFPEESACNVGDPGSIPGVGRSPGGGHGNPLQHSCLENPMDRGPWRATVHGVAESNTTEQLTLSCFFSCQGTVTWPLPEIRLGQRGQQDSLLCSPLEAEASCRPHRDPGPGTVPRTRPPDGCRGGSGTHQLGVLDAGGPSWKEKQSCPVEDGGALGTASHCPPPTWLLVIERRSFAFIFLSDLFDTKHPDLLSQDPCPPELVWGPCGHQPPWWT